VDKLNLSRVMGTDTLLLVLDSCPQSPFIMHIIDTTKKQVRISRPAILGLRNRPLW